MRETARNAAHLRQITQTQRLVKRIFTPLCGLDLWQFGCTHARVLVPAGEVDLAADLSLPHDATGLVLFAHGSGSSRHSPRNRWVADVLNSGSIGTILLDLLTQSEERVDERTAGLRFDIDLLTHRLTAITDWIGEQNNLNKLALGYFGASTGAAAALAAAANRPRVVQAVVSRGGRPDLAGPSAGSGTRTVSIHRGRRRSGSAAPEP